MGWLWHSPSEHGSIVGFFVGEGVGISEVGTVVGIAVGADVGAWTHDVVVLDTITKPGKHSHEYAGPPGMMTHIVDDVSQP